MYFTQEDYLKIQQWLQRNSVKDTEFQEAADLIGNEVVTLVQNGSNKKVYLKDLVNQIFSIGVADFVNISALCNEYNTTLSYAIKLVPYKSRKRGQVITFLNTEGNWEIYQFTGVKNQWNNIELWKDLFDWQAILNLEIEADEEDITANLEENSSKVKLSFKDRQYEPSNHSGLGYKILRKNIVKYIDRVYGELTKNILIQNNISSPNSIYEIRYDFDLNNQTIYIPENSVLRYNGGSLNNGKIVYNNTRIEGKEKIKNISFEGECNYSGFKIRFNNVNEIEVSYDEGENWSIISDSFNTNINIKDYVDEVSSLPNNVALGTVYGVKDESYTSENPKYRIYVYTSNGWIDNGLFAGISAGVVQEVGNSDTKVLSQKAVSENFINKKDIVKDLSSGGIDKVLSAEMGKELAREATTVSMKTKHIHVEEAYDTEEEIVIYNNDGTEEIVKINNGGLTAKKILNLEGKEIEPSGMSVVENDPKTLEICDEKQQPILKIDSKGNVNTASFNSLNVAKNKFKGKTMLYVGDSISTRNIWHWKGYIKDGIGLDYVDYNINDTVNVTPAVGGITIRPHNDDDTRPMNAGAAEVGSGAKSIWWRCCNKRLGIYDFDYINLFGGTNDIYDNNLNVGTIDDAPLIDTDIEDLTTLDLSQVSFASAFMGCIEMLMRDFPGKQIFICTLLYNGYARTPDVVKIQMLAAQKYGLIVVPFYYSELNSQNYQWLCSGFHPNQIAARIMEKNFIEYINL